MLLDCIQLTGDLRLSPIRTVSPPIVITNSEIEGCVEGRLLLFQSAVDFTGTTFLRPPDFSGSTFSEDAIFSGVHLAKDGGTCEPSEPNAGIEMQRVTFQKMADFRKSTFYVAASFEDASFSGRTLFQSAQFDEVGTFRGTRFNEATFVGTTFFGLADFSSVSVGGSLHAESATFLQGAELTDVVLGGQLSFATSIIEDRFVLVRVVADSIDLRSLAGGGELRLIEPRVNALYMEPRASRLIDDVRGDHGEQILALKLIEETYRKEDDLATANEAAYLRNEIETANTSQPERAFRTVVFQWAAGYLVRPLHPLFAAAFVVLFGMAARLLGDPKYGLRNVAPALRKRFSTEARAGSSAVGESPDNEWPWQARAADAFVSAAQVPVSLKPAELLSDDDRRRFAPYLVAGLLLLEFVVQKFLNVAFLLAIANAIPGAKEFVDAILPT